MLARLLLVFSCLLFSSLTFSQVGHPAKGSWSGTLEAKSGESSRIRLFINAHDGELSGVINPGRKSVDIKTAALDAPNWKLSISAEMPEGKLTLNGKLSNLGSWSNRKYQGTYTHGEESGSFEITLN